MSRKVKNPTLIDAFIPIISLVLLLSASVYFFGDSSSQGANQLALLFCSSIGILIGIKNGIKWDELEKGIIAGISTAMGAILILLMVGSLIGTWILSGIVPTMIYYGLIILSPDWFYVASCLICAIVAISIGSSWTVAGTIGIGLIGIAAGLNLSLEVTAGAIISGAYFGDKMSPLSDTTNLAPAVVGTDLFTHIRHMTWTTMPSLIFALIMFTVIGLNSEGSNSSVDISQTTIVLQQNFHINLLLILPVLMILVMAINKVPALATIFIGALIGGVVAVIFQADSMIAANKEIGLSNAEILFRTVWNTMANGYVSGTGNLDVDNLLSRGGMASMLNVVWLIITALTFGAVLDVTGLIQRLVRSILSLAKSTGGVIAATIASCISTNILTADQYIAIVLPGRMFKVEFKRRGLHPKNLSRVLEDSATITSPLIPWNTCGIYMAGTLGVATWAYLPFCFFNLINPVISIIYGYTGFKIIYLCEENEAN